VPGDVPPDLVPLLNLPDDGFARAMPAPISPDGAAVARVIAWMRERPRGLICCGPELGVHLSAPRNSVAHKAWPAAVTQLASRTGYPILAEPPSQLRQGAHDTKRVIAHGEALLRGERFRRSLDPQIVLRFGAMPTAKHVEVLLEEHPDVPVIQVSPGGRWLEPTHHPGELIVSDETAFCAAVNRELGIGPGPDTDWLGRWRTADRAAAEAIAEAFDAPAPAGLGGAWFEGRVFAELAALLPDGALQVTASSMPVRDLDAFTPITATRVRHLVNRGANGIDGTVSTALGAAAAHAGGGAPTVLVTGDVAFVHDANALLAAKAHGLALTVILLNNEGGGIFEFLPVAPFEPAFERHFGTPHGTDFLALCAAFSVPLHRPRDWGEFRARVRECMGSGRTQVIELRTERKLNRDQHRAMWQAVAKRVDGI
jgi:2-succinyl-5-enolpyruvyl-6-hydroxy-3-cyclohexene-1-carboxylate synthase